MNHCGMVTWKEKTILELFKRSMKNTIYKPVKNFIWMNVLNCHCYLNKPLWRKKWKKVNRTKDFGKKRNKGGVERFAWKGGWQKKWKLKLRELRWFKDKRNVLAEISNNVIWFLAVLALSGSLWYSLLSTNWIIE